jgi:hypothetical protein
MFCAARHGSKLLVGYSTGSSMYVFVSLLGGVVRSPHVFFKTCLQSPRLVIPEGTLAVEESFLELTARLRFPLRQYLRVLEKSEHGRVHPD